ncbi:MAG TPA: MBOAT family protein [Syntrophorhabdaceae bacterium]|jgi:D-alanyl-lipoteichoic acid acyltransferase DltB (MBOAT superfamily)
MLFNSYFYIFLFLPLCLIVYFLLNDRRLTKASKAWLVLASFVFYGWWNPIYVPLIAGSIVFNYLVGTSISKFRDRGALSRSKWLLWTGIAGNLALLGYFKYTDFFISNVNGLGGLSLSLLHIALPLGISFFTFTQIAYLVDRSKGKVTEYSFMNYGLFVTFFPHLLAGPIIHHSEMMPQFDRRRNKLLDSENLTRGAVLFFTGLFKKVVIADTFAIWANGGYQNLGDPALVQAWVISLSYTLQLYYDFSGYTDMALGSSRMFNIILPINFDSPYRSLNIQEFWRRWHITLGRFMRDYVYIPLGGNKASEGRILLNIMITFFIVGLWHGAGWTFVAWGCMHGAALVVYRAWNRLHISMPKWLAWLITFNFVNVGWVFFRAPTFADALKILKGMAGLNGSGLPGTTAPFIVKVKEFIPDLKEVVQRMGDPDIMLIMFFLFLPLSFLFRNSNQIAAKFQPGTIPLIVFSCIAALSVLYLGSYSEFLYFRF